MEEVPGEGSSRWLYALLLGLCALVLNAPSLLGSTGLMKSNEKIVLWHQQQKGSRAWPPSFVEFQRRFLTVYFLFYFVEGLQSVYGEALYQSYYKYGRQEIGYILLAAPAGSLIVGTFLGAAADSTGRRKACIVCGLLQSAACCLARYSDDFKILCVANVCRGITVSIFPAVFEALLVCEHERLGFKQEWLSSIFWMMSFGMGVTAIAAGAVANWLVFRLGLGLLAPPSLAAAVSVLWVLMVGSGWIDENASITGKSSQARLIFEGLQNTCQAVMDKRVLLLGWTQACLEFSLSLFWLLWAPTMVADGRDIHTGFMYAYFMASLMLGSVIASLLLCTPLPVRPESFLPWVFGIASLTLFVPAYDHQEVSVLSTAFCVYHVCLGIAWPSLARLRNVYVPSYRRAGVLSLCRVPVSVGVLLILVKGGLMKQIENSTVFYIATFGLLSGALALHFLNKWRRLISTNEEFSSELHRLH